MHQYIYPYVKRIIWTAFTLPDSSLRHRRYINHLLTYLLTLCTYTSFSVPASCCHASIVSVNATSHVSLQWFVWLAFLCVMTMQHTCSAYMLWSSDVCSFHMPVLVHGQVTIIFVVSVCLSVCLFVCAEFFSAVFDLISIKLAHMLYLWV